MNAGRKDIAPELWMSLPEAAKVLGISRMTAKVWALEGRLISMRIVGRIVVSRASVDAYKKNPVRKNAAAVGAA